MTSNGELAGDPPTNGTAPKFGGFKFTKPSKPKSALVPLPALASKLNLSEFAAGDRDQNVEFVTSIDDGGIKGSGGASHSKEKTELVIPLIAVNKYHIPKKPKIEVKTEPTDDDTTANEATAPPTDLASKAKQELLQEARAFKEDPDDPSSIPAWKLMVINKVPDEYESDRKLDVSIRPVESSREDYESVPIEAFGAALLRGMGWKAGDPIGGINKAITPIHEATLRPRGLGLGANASLQQQLKESGKKAGAGSSAGDAILKKGAYVCIEVGGMKGRYGTVQSFDDNLSHVSVKLNLLRETVSLPSAVLRIVNKKEFDTEGRLINKSPYDDYKAKDEPRKPSSTTSDKHKTTTESTSSRSRDSSIWILPHIRVECRDKSSKYYKEKLVILETADDRATCRTKSHKVLDCIRQSDLRTVIPRTGKKVILVRGKNRGSPAILEDVTRKEATIKLVGTHSRPFDVSLNDISEYYEES